MMIPNISVELQTPPFYEDPSKMEEHVPFTANFEQADSSYEKLINFYCNGEEDNKILENSLRLQKKVILYDLQKLLNAGFSEEVVMDAYVKGIDKLKEMAVNFHENRHAFIQDVQGVNNQSHSLLEKIKQVSESNWKPLVGGAAWGAVAGIGVSQTINPIRNYLNGKVEIQSTKQFVKWSSAEATVKLYNDTLSYMIHEFPGPLEDAIVATYEKQKKTVLQTKIQINRLDKIGAKLDNPIPQKKLVRGGALVGGAVGVAVSIVLEAIDAHPAH